MSTKIEWATLTINPIQDKRKGESGRGYHCTKCAPECRSCYAEIINNRFGNHHPFDDTPVEFEIIWKPIEQLAKRRKPATVFVESMGDLFHKHVGTAQIFSILDALRKIDQHRYIFLTKRARRMENISKIYCVRRDLQVLPGNWIGMVTAGTQETANEKIECLLASKFQVRGVSCEPLLEEVNLAPWLSNRRWPVNPQSGVIMRPLSWVIVGAETGSGARAMHPEWVRNIRGQCRQYGTSFFFKSWGAWMPGETKSEPFGPVKVGERCIEHSGKYTRMYRVGAKQAGRLLDGQLWEQMPD